MKVKVVFILLVLKIVACKSIIPNNNDLYEAGFLYSYDNLDFDRIADSSDTSWFKTFKPLAELLMNHPNWTVSLATFMPESASRHKTANVDDRMVVFNVSKYLQSKGIDSSKIITMSYGKSDKFKKDTIQWKILRID